MADGSISGRGIVARLIAALALVYLTFNPERLSFFHWAIEPIFRGPEGAAGRQVPLKLLSGLVLVGAWIVLLQMTRRSIGVKGSLLILGIVATVIWLLVDWHVLTLSSGRAIGHLILIGLALVLTLGMSWSHLSRRLSGQVDTDDIN